MLPLYSAVYALDYFFSWHLYEMLPHVFSVLLQVSISVPLLGVFFVRYIYSKPLDFLFFESLDPELGKALQKLPLPLLSQRVKTLCKKLVKTSCLAVVLLLLSLLPGIGSYMAGIVQFMITYRTFGLKPAIVAMILAIIPGFRSVWLVVVAFGWSARAICLELLNPLVDRLKCDSDATKEFFAVENQVMLLSFALPLTALFMIPLLGPLTLPLLQSAVAVLAENLANKTTIKRLVETKGVGQQEPPPGGPKFD